MLWEHAGHSKAVAYVRFMGAGQAVSASTDSTLRLWDLSTQVPHPPSPSHASE